MLIPAKLLITLTKVANSECGEMIRNYPDMFQDDKNAEYTQLAVFLLQEKIKGVKVQAGFCID